MIPSVQLKNVFKRFGDVVPVDNINLAIIRGEFFSILGPSGCGKTTTMRIIGGLEHPDEGEVFISGKLVNNIPPYKRDCSIVFQNLALFPHLSVHQNIAFGLQFKDLSNTEISQKVSEMLELVELKGLGERKPRQLSGGQQQRVALARSIVLKPEVLLLDEPLASLDRKLRDSMRIEIRKIQKEIGITFIYVTHDLEEALSMSDHIAVMKNGKFLQIGTPVEIHDHPKTRFVADFMGATNILAGKIVNKNSSGASILTEGGLSVIAPANDQSVNDPISISISPEAIEIRPANDEWEIDNKFPARIVENVYLGDVSEIIIALNKNESIKAKLTRHTRLISGELNVGDEIQVGWRKEDINSLAD
ncbi:Spermidine/putrescine import ABC transporter ATP-binding protein PotA (TC 3.A.1.11.1) [Olavius sp. associated proteobacterium Delta 1]|nr:Spermidine/putrescine import ABC transporter ATP-binding protein PotA (TC 3.A.1.11.1) [Olavius sp. associated proteobacterium Delta 1]